MVSLALVWLGLFASMRAQGAWGVAYAPADVTAARPAIVFFHGMWASPEDSCAIFERGTTRFGFLVCPRGNAPLGAGRMWAGTAADADRQMRAALAAAETLAPGKLDATAGGTLIGYSNGAYFAAEVACAQPGRWTGLVLMSMKLDLDATRLRRARIRRVVLAAGDEDSARPPMQHLADRLTSQGVQTRFVSLGPGGHPFPSDMAERMVDVIAWARGADSL
jgi:predicted esterase